MASPLLLSDNLFNQRIYPANVITAVEETPGHEILNVGDGRRSQFDYWTPVTTNVVQRVTVDAITAVSTSCCALDRGHNLFGKTVTIDGADDVAFTTNVITPFSAALPSSITAGASIDGANGALTEEGAWLKRYAVTAARRFWRLSVSAMGTGLKPVVVGLWLGRSYDPPAFFTPSSMEGAELHVATRVSEWFWRGRGPSTPARSGTLNLRFNTVGDYEAARATLMLQYLRGRPMWICYDSAQAERSFLTLCPEEARIAPGFEPGWFPQQVKVPYLEHQPLRAA